MSRDRFLLIFWNLHLCYSVSLLASQSQKVQPLLDLLGPKFSAAYKLGKFVAADEAIIAFNGRSSFKQYMRAKPHPFRIKAFVLADSATGYLHGLRLYFGKEMDICTDPQLQTTCTVLTLTQPLEGLHHHVITDWFYSSPELGTELEKRGLAFTGNAQVNR